MLFLQAQGGQCSKLCQQIEKKKKEKEKKKRSSDVFGLVLMPH